MPWAGILSVNVMGSEVIRSLGTRNKGAPGLEPGFLEVIKSEMLGLSWWVKYSNILNSSNTLAT